MGLLEFLALLLGLNIEGDAPPPAPVVSALAYDGDPPPPK